MRGRDRRRGFTNAANPTSTALYQRIGYRPTPTGPYTTSTYGSMQATVSFVSEPDGHEPHPWVTVGRCRATGSQIRKPGLAPTVTLRDDRIAA